MIKIKTYKKLVTSGATERKYSSSSSNPLHHLSRLYPTIQYSVKQFTKHEKVTKRSILSTIAQIYDPLGLIAPITIIAKQIMQQLWQCGLSWDESVPNVIFTKWIKFISQLDSINHIHAPRHVLCKNPKQIELHGFCDSSESAYGACIFIKSVDANSDIHTNLLCAKSRVAPLRNTTLPRLELCGALLLAQLANKIINTIELKFDEIYYWCDSTIVLSWINSPSNKWQTFVANRVSQIQNLSDVKQWRHVRSEQNSADLLTRGLDAQQLVNCKLWWKGPTWLYNNDENCFLNNEFVISNEISIPEMRKNQVVLLATKRLDIITKYSSLSTLIHVMAYLLRYMHNLRAKSLQVERKSNSLSVDELNNAKKSLVKLAQREHFSQELNLLKDGKRILKGKLVKLSPFLDDESLIRVGGRLQNSEFSYNKQHPLVIPGKHALTTLILKHEHEELKHCGPQILLATVREQYWPVSGRNAARKIVRNCVKCSRARPKFNTQMMGNLPKARISPAPPFAHCGIDYGGPFYLKDKKSRGCKIIKAYICLFVCFTTKALHLELVSDLTAECFIAALRRFCARRGKPTKFYSDNGTNFVRANKELKELANFLNSDQIMNVTEKIRNEGIEWEFIPPSAPHFGGLWEAGIKSVKLHLTRVFRSASLIYEEFLTVLTQIEAILNSRPLSPLSTDPNDLNPLTPAHFLIGRTLTAPPDPSVLEINETKLSRYQRLQALVQHYWARWSKEYISELQQRTKWFNSSADNINIGAIVVVKDDNHPPLNWKLGRVVELHPGNDGLVRVVSIKVQNGVIKRPLVKLCILPV